MDPPKLSTFVVPTTTSPWIWPYNDKIIRDPLRKLWILPFMGVLDLYIWLIAPSFPFDDWKLEVLWSFIWCFHYDGWWLILPIFLLIPWVNWWLNVLTLNVFWWYDHCWTHLNYHLPFKSLLSGLSLSTLFTLPMTLFTIQRVVICLPF